MSDSNSDKTRIKKTQKRAEQVDDKTRIAPAKTVVKPRLQVDQTRSVSPGNTRQRKSDSEDICPTQPDYLQHNSTTNSDGTKIVKKQSSHTMVATRVMSHGDQDIVKTRDTHAEDQDENIPLEPVDLSQMGDHGVLKKRFVLESVLGSGGMGIVYKAKDLLKVEAQDRDPYVAIKVLGEEFKSHPAAFISLQRESRKSQRIAHPNIVNVHDFDKDGDTVFMTMEFLDGSPLDELIRRYKATGLPTEDAWIIIKGMCAALSHAHAEKIIHSDFKPGNVFVTKKGLAKVFDFGIARAVARVEHIDDNPEDKTMFDAGNLGALTPAYASLEMLQGKEPDVRDDIFALGCVAYEIFMAEHPYKKIPADDAVKLRIKPKRIPNINKRQWRAIESAIAFKREDRIKTVDEFLEQISPGKKTTNRMATFFALLLSVAITVYFLYFQQQTPVEPAFSEDDITLKVTMGILEQDIQQLLDKPLFTDAWQDSIWLKLSELVALTKNETPWVKTKKQQIYSLYLAAIDAQIKLGKYTSASNLIINAKRYSDDEAELAIKTTEISRALERQKIARAEAAAKAEKEKIKQQRLARKRQQELLARQKQQKTREQQKILNSNNTRIFDSALDNVNNQLRCLNRLNMRNIESAINKLREIDIARYKSMENKIIRSLASCIQQTGRLNPERALAAKNYSLRIFKFSELLAGLAIEAKDVCDNSLAGLGARGKRAVCRDKIKGVGSGPELVVIPGSSRIETFAIGKYEVSIEEMNRFCHYSSSCNVITDRNVKLPVTNIDIAMAEKYLDWLSQKTARNYRLPTRKEWVYAAKSRSKNLDANRNCKVSTRGIQKGEGLVISTIGMQNGWGLVNYVGNAQEWVYDKGRKLKAVGGSYAQALDNCDITTSHSHNGSADKITGFRVIREVGNSS